MGAISRNGEPGSSTWSTRSRGKSLPRFTCRSRDVDGAALAHDLEPLAKLGDQFFHAVRLASAVNAR